MGIKTMDNPEKEATYSTQDEEKQSKNMTQYILDTTTLYIQTTTYNVNKTWSPLQTTGRKDEPNIMFMRTS